MASASITRTNSPDHDICFDLEDPKSEPALIASRLHQKGMVLLRNVLPRNVVVALGESVISNAKKLAIMLDKTLNDLPFCFSDFSSSHPSFPVDLKQAFPDFEDAITVSRMDRSWYFDGERN